MSDYYILGSKANMGDGRWENRLPDMLAQRLLHVGWGWEHRSFEHLYGKPEQEIVSALKRLGEPPASYNAHKLFLNLRPGDWVAIKTDGAPRGTRPNLTISAFARVVIRDGTVYCRGRAPLAHCINAGFVQHGRDYTFSLGYGATIHRLSKDAHIRRIFAPVLGKQVSAVRVPTPPHRAQWRRKEMTIARVEDQTRMIAGRKIIARMKHHRLRNKLYTQLVQQHGEQKVLMERDWVDLQVEENAGITLYEIKPYRSVVMCIRQALGQVLSYAWMEASPWRPKIKLIVVGPSVPDREEREFIGFVQHSLRIGFDYLPFK